MRISICLKKMVAVGEGPEPSHSGLLLGQGDKATENLVSAHEKLDCRWSKEIWYSLKVITSCLQNGIFNRCANMIRA